MDLSDYVDRQPVHGAMFKLYIFHNIQKVVEINNRASAASSKGLSSSGPLVDSHFPSGSLAQPGEPS